MSHLSTLTLHALRYDELEADEAEAARAHLATCARCAARLQAQENHRAAFELRPVPEAIKNPPAEVIRPRFGRWIPALALAAVALLALRLATLPDEPENLIKGGASVAEAWVDDASGGHAVAHGEAVHEGDRIQVRFKRPPLPQVALAGVDGNGSIEIYGRWTADQEPERWQTTPFSLRLDDTPGDLQLVLVFSEDPLSEKGVRSAASGQPPRGAVVRRLHLDKEP